MSASIWGGSPIAVAAFSSVFRSAWSSASREFASKALDHWAYWNGIQLDFSRPGKPTDNAFAEAFNATVRRERLSQRH